MGEGLLRPKRCWSERSCWCHRRTQPRSRSKRCRRGRIPAEGRHRRRNHRSLRTDTSEMPPRHPREATPSNGSKALRSSARELHSPEFHPPTGTTLRTGLSGGASARRGCRAQNARSGSAYGRLGRVGLCESCRPRLDSGHFPVEGDGVVDIGKVQELPAMEHEAAFAVFLDGAHVVGHHDDG
jgi:hypothetical protein